jgi:hypothetical protein
MWSWRTRAAGVAAALAARQAAGDVGKLDVRALQHALSAQGFLLDPALLKLRELGARNTRA